MPYLCSLALDASGGLEPWLGQSLQISFTDKSGKKKDLFHSEEKSFSNCLIGKKINFKPFFQVNEEMLFSVKLKMFSILCQVIVIWSYGG